MYFYLDFAQKLNEQMKKENSIDNRFFIDLFFNENGFCHSFISDTIDIHLLIRQV